jgi:hypothetical protein
MSHDTHVGPVGLPGVIVSLIPARRVAVRRRDARVRRMAALSAPGQDGPPGRHDGCPVDATGQLHSADQRTGRSHRQGPTMCHGGQSPGTTAPAGVAIKTAHCSNGDSTSAASSSSRSPSPCSASPQPPPTRLKTGDGRSDHDRQMVDECGARRDHASSVAKRSIKIRNEYQRQVWHAQRPRWQRQAAQTA